MILYNINKLNCLFKSILLRVMIKLRVNHVIENLNKNYKTVREMKKLSVLLRVLCYIMSG